MPPAPPASPRSPDSAVRMVVHAPHLGPRPRRTPPASPAPAARVVRQSPDPDTYVDLLVAQPVPKLRGLSGPRLWAALHRRALAVPPGTSDNAWLAGFREILPCGDCRQHWDGMVAATPPPAAPDLFAWTVARHNEVNRRLGKPEMALEAALQRWSGAGAAPLQR